MRSLQRFFDGLALPPRARAQHQAAGEIKQGDFATRAHFLVGEVAEENQTGEDQHCADADEPVSSQPQLEETGGSLTAARIGGAGGMNGVLPVSVVGRSLRRKLGTNSLAGQEGLACSERKLRFDRQQSPRLA